MPHSLRRRILFEGRREESLGAGANRSENMFAQFCAAQAKLKEILVTAVMLSAMTAQTAICQPSWVKSRSSEKYPDNLYILGVGFANKSSDRAADLQKAYDAAFADIAKEIKATVASQSTTKEYEVLSENKNSLESKTSAEIKVSSDVKLGGLKIVDTYDDNDNNLEWALAILDRRSAGEQLKETLKSYLAGYSKSFEMSNTSAGNLRLVLLNLSDALKNAVWYNDLLPVYNYITEPLTAADSMYILPSAFITSKAEAAAQDALSSLRVEKVSGDAQTISAGSEVKSLVVRVTRAAGHTIPVEGIRLKFGFVSGGGKLSGASTTDETGTARCDIYQLTPFTGNVYTISASTDLSEFKLPGNGSSDFSNWNQLMDGNSSEVLFRLERSSNSLNDRLTNAVLRATSRIQDTSTTITVSKIFFQDKLPGPMAEFLRQRLELAIQSSTSLAIVSQDAVRLSQMQLSQSGYSESLAQPDYASLAAGARYVLTGSYWKENDNLDLTLKVVDVLSHVLIGSATASLPMEMLPKVSLAPDNYNPQSDEKLMKTESKGENLKVELWVDRPDGIYHQADTMSIYVRASRDCYIALVYNDAGGEAVLVFPNKVKWDSRIKGGTIYQVPGTFVVSPPFGREILKAYASDNQVPIPQGTEINGLVLLKSADDFQRAVRNAGESGDGYAESSLVITTMPGPGDQTNH